MRFTPKKRTAVDGRMWWCIYDNERGDWSSYVCHVKYKTRKVAQYAIDRFNKEWGLDKA